MSPPAAGDSAPRMPRSAVVRLDRYRQAAPQLYELLRERIVSLQMPPGTAISRGGIAAEFGVSQTPVRDALLLLQQEDLVEVFPQSATAVSRIDLAQAERTHFLRRAVELEIVRQLAESPDKALVQQLRAHVARQEQARDAGDFQAFTDADRAFHEELYRAVGQEDLHRLVRSRSGHVDRLRRLHVPTPGKARKVIADHTAIVRAIAAGQPAEAQERLRQHLSGTLAQAADIRAAHPEFFR